MDRIDSKRFQQLINEATSILSNKVATKDLTINEAVDAGVLTEEEMEIIQNHIFEQTILIPAIDNLIEQIEEYHGVELTEEQLNELRGGLSALFGRTVGGAATLGKKLAGAAVTGTKKVGGLLAAGAKAVANPIAGAVRSGMDTYAAGEKAAAEAKAKQAGKVAAAPTALGKIAAALPRGAGTAAGFKAGVTQHNLHKLAKETGHGSLEDLKTKLKAKGYKGKVKVKNVGGKLHVDGAELADSYIFSRENGQLILESIIQK